MLWPLPICISLARSSTLLSRSHTPIYTAPPLGAGARVSWANCCHTARSSARAASALPEQRNTLDTYQIRSTHPPRAVAAAAAGSTSRRGLWCARAVRRLVSPRPAEPIRWPMCAPSSWCRSRGWRQQSGAHHSWWPRRARRGRRSAGASRCSTRRTRRRTPCAPCSGRPG